MSIRIYTGLAAALVLIIGVLGLFSDVTTMKTGKEITCGTGVSSNLSKVQATAGGQEVADAMLGLPSVDRSTLAVAACEDAMDARHLWTWPLVGLGVIIGLGAVVAERRARDKAWAESKAATT